MVTPSSVHPCDAALPRSSSVVSERVDVESLLSSCDPSQEKLERERRLPNSRIALYQVQAIPRKAAPEDVVESSNAR